MTSTPRLRTLPDKETTISRPAPAPAPADSAPKPAKFCRCSLIVWLLLFALVALAVVAAVLLPEKHHHWHDDNDDSGANLVLHDSQRLVLGAPNYSPEPGDQDIILIVVNNVDDHDVVNITVTIAVTSAARKRSPISLPVICPPLYTTNVLAYLATRESATCRAVYTITEGDIVNGNVIHTESMATGSIEGTDWSTVAEPGMSRLLLTDVWVPEGALLAGPTGASGAVGPTGPTGPVNIATGPCSDVPPVTSLVCGPLDQLKLLVCNTASNITQIGNMYMCVGTQWVFFGSLDMHGDTNSTGPPGPPGPPGIGIYAATCSGGPPPVNVTNPAYTCNAAFNLNMVLCALPSPNGNSGLIYECQCTPTCGWVEVADVNGPLTWYWYYRINNGDVYYDTTNLWTMVVYSIIYTPGTYWCTFEGIITTDHTAYPCPLFYGMTSVAGTNLWLENSNREVNVSPMGGGHTPIVPIITTATVEVTTAPETVYVNAGIYHGASGCGLWRTVPQVGQTLRCLKLF